MIDSQRFLAAISAAAALVPAIIVAFLVARTRKWKDKEYTPFDIYIGALASTLICAAVIIGNYNHIQEPVAFPTYIMGAGLFVAAFLWIKRLGTFFDRAGSPD